MNRTTSLLSLAVVATLIFTGCGSGSSSGDPTDPKEKEPTTQTTLIGDITADKTLTADKVWLLEGQVVVTNGATLTIEPGTTVAGKEGSGANAGWMVIDTGAKIMAQGTAAKPIIFTSKASLDGDAETAGQWGGLTLIGNAGNDQTTNYEVDQPRLFTPGQGQDADNSGVLTHVKILNTGKAVAQDKEINGLSLVAIGSGTTISDITIERSGDDGVELWGGTVNLSNITINGAKDDSFDVDQGWSGTVTNLTITGGTKAGIEMSGTTHATFDGFNITVGAANTKEGGIYFKAGDGEAIGGHFKNGTITYNSTTTEGHGAIHSKGTFDNANTSFTNVTLAGTNTDKFTGSASVEIEAVFDAGSGNSK